MPPKGWEREKVRKGMKFGRLRITRVVSRLEVYCRCKCGGTKRTNKYDLLYGNTTSCGCYNREMSTKRIVQLTLVHGKSNTYEHKHWWQMVRRCTDPKFPMYEKYGKRGLYVQPNWIGAEGFVRFLDHIGLAPSQRHTIDRIDNKGNYVEGNVRWVTPKEQGRNRSTNVLLTAFGKTQCITAWADEMRLKKTTIMMRLERGWSHQDAVSVPPGTRWKVKTDARMITALGKMQHLAAWARETGLNPRTITTRLKFGWSPDDAVSRRLMREARHRKKR